MICSNKFPSLDNSKQMGNISAIFSYRGRRSREHARLLSGELMRPTVAFVAAALLCGSALAQQQATPPELKSLESAVALVQSLIQFALLLIGGTVVILLSASYHRPKNVLVRGCYLLFIPGWALLGLSVNSGVRAQGAYTSYLIRSKADLTQTKATMTGDANNQVFFLKSALVVFGIWLFIYLLWWIFNKEEATQAGMLAPSPTLPAAPQPTAEPKPSVPSEHDR